VSKAWYFDSGALNTLKKSDGLYIRIEISNPQSLANWKAASPSALPAPDFTTDLTEGDEFAFNVPKITRISNTEPGAGGNSSLTIEAQNVYVGTSGDDVASGDLVEGVTYQNVGYTTVTYEGTDYVDGQYFTATSTATYTTAGAGTVEKKMTLYDIIKVDYVDYDVHFRVSTKTTSGGSYVVRYWGVIDLRSIELEVHDVDRPQTWNLRFGVDDCLQQLTKITAAKWMDATLQRATYDYTCTNNYLTFINDFDFAAAGLDTTYEAGKYLLESVYSNADLGDHVFELATQIRYIKITDVLQSIHDLLGCEATSINDGGAWSDFHSWTFYYNTANSVTPGGETIASVGIDELYVVSGFYRSSEYFEDFTFFSPLTENGQFSWKLMGDPLEPLKKICESFGMTYRTRVNSSGERYLEFMEYGKYSTTKTITSYDDNLSTKLKPNEISTSGIEIVSPGSQTGSKTQASNVVWGSDGTDSLKYDCWFVSTNTLRSNHALRVRASSTAVSGTRAAAIQPADTDFFCSLYTLQDITTKAATNGYSICMIAPTDNGNVIPEPTGTPNVPVIPDWAEWRAGQSAVVVPDSSSTDPQYFTFTEVPAMALALYLFSVDGVSDNPVGFVRPRGAGIEYEEVGIDHTTVEHPPMKLSLTLMGVDYDFVVTEIEEDIATDTVIYRGHTRDV